MFPAARDLPMSFDNPSHPLPWGFLASPVRNLSTSSTHQLQHNYKLTITQPYSPTRVLHLKFLSVPSSPCSSSSISLILHPQHTLTYSSFPLLPLPVPQIPTHHPSFWVTGPATSPIAIPSHQVKYVAQYFLSFTATIAVDAWIHIVGICSQVHFFCVSSRTVHYSLLRLSSSHTAGPMQALGNVWGVGDGRGEWLSFSYPHCSFQNAHCINEG